MHDALIGESFGKPSVGVITNKFVSAAKLMAQVHGMDNYPFVVIDHPISSVSIDTLDAWAKFAVDKSEELLIVSNG